MLKLLLACVLAVLLVNAVDAQEYVDVCATYTTETEQIYCYDNAVEFEETVTESERYYDEFGEIVWEEIVGFRTIRVLLAAYQACFGERDVCEWRRYVYVWYHYHCEREIYYKYTCGG